MGAVLTDSNETGLGPVPEGWDIVNLGDICDQQKENVDPSTVAAGVYVGLEHMEPGNPRLINWGRPAEVRSGKTRFCANDILYGKLRTYLDKAVLANRDGICSTDIIVFRCRDGDALPEFLIHAFHTRQFLSHAVRTTHGVNHPRTSWASLRQFELALPRLDEQRRIARVLWTIQRAIEAQDKVIAAARELKRSLMKHLFTYGPVSVAESSRVPLKETEIGPVPDHWEVLPLGRVLKALQYGLSLRGSSEGRIPILRMNNLQNGRVLAENLQHVDIGSDLLAKFQLSPGDVLFNRTNSMDLVGKTGLFDLNGQFVFASYLLRLVTDAHQLLPEVLTYYLNQTSAQRRLKGLATRGVSQSNISATRLRTFVLPRIPLGEQHQIAGELAASDMKIEAEEKRKAALQALFKSMLHHLMSGKIRIAEGN
jgi:type I restriction enzyme, S subunit